MKFKNILFICKYFHDSSVHKSLISHLCDSLNYESSIFIASEKKINIDQDLENNYLFYKYPFVCKYFLLFRSFLSFIYLKKVINFRAVELVFCHTLVVDGLIGFISFIFFKKPYVIMIRQTDLYFYHKYFIHLRWIYVLILKYSKCIGFTSLVLRDRFLSIYGNAYSKKSKIWPNGVHIYWIERNRMYLQTKYVDTNYIRVVFVGRYLKNKNLFNTYLSILKLRSSNNKIQLHFVGGSTEALLKIINLNKLPCWIINHGKLDKVAISNLFDISHCLCVPSFRESFGLVYIEALSRGLPVIYSKGQGIDKFFTNHVFSVNPHSISSISRAIVSATSASRVYVDVSDFDWHTITNNIKNDIKVYVF